MTVKYDKTVLHTLTQWKHLSARDYVMGLEPCNNLVKGVDYEYKHGNLRYIEPGESINIRLDINFYGSLHEIEKAKAEITGIAGTLPNSGG